MKDRDAIRKEIEDSISLAKLDIESAIGEAEISISEILDDLMFDIEYKLQQLADDEDDDDS